MFGTRITQLIRQHLHYSKYGSVCIYCRGMPFSYRDLGTCKDRENKDWSQMQSNPRGEADSQKEIGAEICISMEHKTRAYRQNSPVMAMV